MSNIAIRVEELSKQYQIGRAQSYGTLRETLSSAVAAPMRRIGAIFGNGQRQVDEKLPNIWALRDVSFEVKTGEVIGIIGRNGAGKSTLLKILSRITEPTSGCAEIYGRSCSLLEVGSGFHLELTGRENIYLNGAILGMKKAAIDRNLDAILSFADIEKFTDTPVKHYSSGMYLRLAFAVAAHLEPDIFFVDEVLAVGDADFQNKCLGKMDEVANRGRTVFFVSHNLSAIARLCSRTIWIDNGQLKLDGPTDEIIAAYLSRGTVKSSTWIASPQTNEKPVRILSAKILSMAGQPTSLINFQQDCKVEIEYEIRRQPIKDLSIQLRQLDSLGNILWTSWDTDKTGWNSGFTREPGRYISSCSIPSNLLKPGIYHLSIGSVHRGRSLEWEESALSFEVSTVGFNLNASRMGFVLPLLDWEIRQINTEPPLAVWDIKAAASVADS